MSQLLKNLAWSAIVLIVGLTICAFGLELGGVADGGITAFAIALFIAIVVICLLPLLDKWRNAVQQHNIAIKEGRVRETLESRLCAGCNYSLVGNTSGFCPECGMRVIDVETERLDLQSALANAIAERKSREI